MFIKSHSIFLQLRNRISNGFNKNTAKDAGTDIPGSVPQTSSERPYYNSLSQLCYCYIHSLWRHKFQLRLTEQLTTCTWVLLQKLTISQLVNKFPALYGKQRFITVFTKAHHRSTSWATSIQSVLSHPVSLRPILAHLCLGVSKSIFHCRGYSKQSVQVRGPI
jgi:hypothetical protein